MGEQINPKIVGATIIGFALVAGAYTVSNFGESNFPEQSASIQVSTVAQRVAIAVDDSDGDGIEDWQDRFLENSTFINTVDTNTSATTYRPPDTLTGKTSVALLENMIGSKLYAPISPGTDVVINETVESLVALVEPKLLSSLDIEVMEEWDQQDVMNYANTAAATIYRHSDGNLESETEMLSRIIRKEGSEESDLVALQSKANAYQNILEDTLKIPVPKILAKEHLDLVNTYKVVFEDITGMTEVINDPLLALLHLKRYSEGVEAMHLSLQNIFLALLDLQLPFSEEDPALLFIIFSPDFPDYKP